MTFGNIMFGLCVVFAVLGTVGLAKDIRTKARQRKQEKHYAALREANADNG